MQSPSIQCLIFGLLACVAGCYSPYGYQSPYGPGPYGQPYQPAPVYPGPGTPYIPGGGTIQPGIGTPTPLNPPGTTNPPSTYDNSGGGIKFDDAPTFDPNPGGTVPGNSGGNRVVPDPLEDTGSGPAATRPGLTPTSNSQPADDFESPFGDSNTGAGSPAQPASVTTEPDLFEPPQRLSSGVRARSPSIQQVSFERQPLELNPFGRDGKHANPQWLRGVIDYDSRERTWQIIYSATPDQRDPNGGSLTLGSHPDLSNCHSGDIVLVEGAINASQFDKRGKPLYALDAVTPLKTP